MNVILDNCRLIAIIRCDAQVDLVRACQALYAGGINAVEITLPTPGALEAIAAVRHDLGEGRYIGAGTVLDVDDARRATDAGSQFLVTPILDLHVVHAAVEWSVPVMPGAFTPTEIYAAWKAGASLVKVFPAGRLGPGFLKDILAPMPMLKLAPTGGVSLDNLAEWYRAGAFAAGAGSSLARKVWLADGDWGALQDEARRWADVAAEV